MECHYKVFKRTYEYNTESNILKLTFEIINDEGSKYVVYLSNIGAKLTNVEEFDTIE